MTECNPHMLIAAGKFPVRVIAIGSRRRVLRSDLLRCMEGEGRRK
jgi:hypothetical protein